MRFKTLPHAEALDVLTFTFWEGLALKSAGPDNNW